ncbi:hypothetical protein CRUP_015393, partial [Coryphaenoides rupestris]
YPVVTISRSQSHELLSSDIIISQEHFLYSHETGVKNNRELQRELIMLACSFGNKHCHRQAVTLISDWISSNNN